MAPLQVQETCLHLPLELVVLIALLELPVGEDLPSLIQPQAQQDPLLRLERTLQCHLLLLVQDMEHLPQLEALRLMAPLLHTTSHLLDHPLTHTVRLQVHMVLPQLTMGLQEQLLLMVSLQAMALPQATLLLQALATTNLLLLVALLLAASLLQDISKPLLRLDQCLSSAQVVESLVRSTPQGLCLVPPSPDRPLPAILELLESDLLVSDLLLPALQESLLRQLACLLLPQAIWVLPLWPLLNTPSPSELDPSQILQA